MNGCSWWYGVNGKLLMVGSDQWQLTVSVGSKNMEGQSPGIVARSSWGLGKNTSSVHQRADSSPSEMGTNASMWLRMKFWKVTGYKELRKISLPEA